MSEREVYRTDGWMFLNKFPTLTCLATMLFFKSTPASPLRSQHSVKQVEGTEERRKEGRKKGRKEGRKEGKKEGRKEGRKEHVQHTPALLTFSFITFSRDLEEPNSQTSLTAREA